MSKYKPSVRGTFITDRQGFINFMKEGDCLKKRKEWLKDDKLRFWYCQGIRDLPEVWAEIKSCKYKAIYCRLVEDRRELWSSLEDPAWRRWYCNNVSNRAELWPGPARSLSGYDIPRDEINTMVLDGLVKAW